MNGEAAATVVERVCADEAGTEERQVRSAAMDGGYGPGRTTVTGGRRGQGTGVGGVDGDGGGGDRATVSAAGGATRVPSLDG
jgi:hypothetical protein